MFGDSTGVWSLLPPRKRGIPVLKVCDSRPNFLVRCSHQSKDFVDLVNFGVSREERSFRHHFNKDCTNGPDIDRRCISLAPQKNLWRTVPQSHNLVSEGSNWWAERTSESKICELETAIPRHEKILRLQISMHNSSGVTKCKSPNALEEIGLDQERREQPAARLHVLFQILVKELEYQIELPVFLNTIFQLNDIFMRQFPKQTDFAKCRRRNPFVFDFQSDAF
mmetsp:Transcript_34194/g.80530  ORF Transcript_34194/g.80530 Transcript_34194/m.80530 type:complete len:223 (-) Transcript_34194:284-952(-)